ncbi:hypothetical protein FIBSPDRAFT_882360 [Athelia psychrophila]|uniref:Zn(2)-C6 fungal-type domain-containing protein n=1 Tax=Athelia psychrophila TaxID=1759441 RepID=A0A166V9H9_9AGAM|nr:hypothetical protein FIBSPDRAFT_882360 [Fibularhizoctonia sp. CBS 109695]
MVMQAPAGYSGMPVHIYPHNGGLESSSKPSRSKHKQAKNACPKCQTAHKKCDGARPCLRCKNAWILRANQGGEAVIRYRVEEYVDVYDRGTSRRRAVRRPRGGNLSDVAEISGIPLTRSYRTGELLDGSAAKQDDVGNTGGKFETRLPFEAYCGGAYMLPINLKGGACLAPLNAPSNVHQQLGTDYDCARFLIIREVAGISLSDALGDTLSSAVYHFNNPRESPPPVSPLTLTPIVPSPTSTLWVLVAVPARTSDPWTLGSSTADFGP